MKITMNRTMFVQEMMKIRPDELSWEALETIFEYFEELAPDAEFDPIAIFSAFSEYEDREELEQTYSMPLAEIMEETTILTTSINSYIAQEF